MKSDQNLLWLAQTGKDFGCRPSDLIGVDDETLALNFDLACSNRLLQFENKRDYKRLESLIKSLYVMVAGFFGQTVKSDDISDPETDGETPEIDADDPDVW